MQFPKSGVSNISIWKRVISFGLYPDVSLAHAREQREEARGLLARGIDPSEHRRAEERAKISATETTFEKVVAKWLAFVSINDKQPGNVNLITRRLERDALPHIGAKPIASLTRSDIQAVADRIVERGTIETAHRVISYIHEIFEWAVDFAPIDPTRGVKIPKPPPPKHFAAPTKDPKKVGELLRLFDGYQGHPAVKAALLVAPLLAVRPGDLRRMRWADIDLDAAKWTFIPGKTQIREEGPMIVPLSRQAVEILRKLHPITGHLEWCFPGGHTTTRPLSENGVLAAMRRMGISTEEMTGHGWRAIFRTMGDEILGIAPHLLEYALGHFTAVRGALGAAYHRAEYVVQRREAMQRWADYLDKLKVGDEMILISKKPA